MKMENSNQSISGHPKTEVSRVGHVELLRAENFCHFNCRHVHYSYHLWQCNVPSTASTKILTICGFPYPWVMDITACRISAGIVRIDVGPSWEGIPRMFRSSVLISMLPNTQCPQWENMERLLYRIQSPDSTGFLSLVTFHVVGVPSFYTNPVRTIIYFLNIISKFTSEFREGPESGSKSNPKFIFWTMPCF